jgi:RNA methyltransferase
MIIFHPLNFVSFCIETVISSPIGKQRYELDLYCRRQQLWLSRLNYIHWVEDLLRQRLPDAFPSMKLGGDVTGIDIGTGASVIYPLLGNHVWISRDLYHHFKVLDCLRE